ncbi:MAG: D-2-hydroxyacid dehydrogenase [Verrucomicrobiales bacterium]|nr:D-2-hydroxyacid dehydrogenase [Verrucomicrobiales bacterium]
MSSKQPSSPSIVFLDAGTTDVDDLDFSQLEKIGQLTCHDLVAPNDIIEKIADAQIILTNKIVIDKEIIKTSPNLKLIQVVATGYNNVDIKAAKQRNIAVCNVSGYSTPAVAQHTITLLLNLATRIHNYATEASEWPESPYFTRLNHPITELSGKTLGIAGMGTIGSLVATIAEALGMEVISLKRDGQKQRPSDANSRPRLDHDEFFTTCDAISLHCPLTPETHHLINAETLSQMKKSAFLINTGRGDLIDEPALAEALRNKEIAAAALDVISVEPPPVDHALLAADIPNLIITPHTAWASLESRQRLIDGVTENIKAFLAGESRNRLD